MYNETMADIIKLHRGLYRNFPDAFQNRYDGSSVAQIIRADGMPIEIGQQGEGSFIPSYAPAHHHAVIIGPWAARETIIVQWASAHVRPARPKVLDAHTERAMLTRCEPHLGDAASSHTQTISRQKLDPLLRRTIEGAHLLNAEQAATFTAETQNMPTDAVLKIGQEFYGQAGALAVINLSSL